LNITTTNEKIFVKTGTNLSLNLTTKKLNN